MAAILIIDDEADGREFLPMLRGLAGNADGL